MSGFLDQMADSSRERARAARAREPLAAMQRRARSKAPAPALKLDGRFDLIAELKLRSPALGQLGTATHNLMARVTDYARAGAAAVSVLTEPERFDGSLGHLEAAAAALAPLGVPAMRKDFLVDPYQVFEARAAGAGGVLLIVRMLSREALTEMLGCARELGMFVLLETFDAEDIGIARDVLPAVQKPAAVGHPDASQGKRSAFRTPAPQPGGALVLVGVNSRDLQSLEVVPERFAALAERLPQDRPRVAESGLESVADIERVARAGYDMALVGGALMNAGEPGTFVRAMLDAGRAARS